jgi:hypothetical protein
MGTRDVGFVALGRWLAVEEYCQSQPTSSTHPRPGAEVDRTQRRPSRPDRRRRSGPVPALPVRS